MFRRDDYDPDVEDEVSQFRRQAESVDVDEEEWDRESTPPWEHQAGEAYPPESDVAPVHQQVATETRASVVSAEATWTGTLASDGPIEIYGVVNGELIAAGNVYVAPGASVNARVQAVNLTVAGTLEGSIACTNRFEVLESGEVRSDVLAPTIVVHDGARVIGEFRMRDDEPDEPIAEDDQSDS